MIEKRKILAVLLSGTFLIGLAGCVVTPEPIPLFDGAVGGDLPHFDPDLDNERADSAAFPDLDYVPEDAFTSMPDAGPPALDGWALDGWQPDGLSDGQPDGLLEDGGPDDGGPGEGGSGEGGPVDDAEPASDLTGDVVSQE